MFYVLPQPRTKGSVSPERCLLRRRKVRVYRRAPLTLAEVGRLLWATRYVHMEARPAAQNVCLQATALGLGTVTVGAFRDDKVKQIAGLREAEEPIYLMPVGRQ